MGGGNSCLAGDYCGEGSSTAICRSAIASCSRMGSAHAMVKTTINHPAWSIPAIAIVRQVRSNRNNQGISLRGFQVPYVVIIKPPIDERFYPLLLLHAGACRYRPGVSGRRVDAGRCPVQVSLVDPYPLCKKNDSNSNPK